MSIGRSGLVNSLKLRIRRMGPVGMALRYVAEWCRTAYLRAVRGVKGIDHDKVIFSCLIARSYGDNLKPISELLHAQRPQTKIVWMFRDPAAKKSVVPDYVTVCDPISLKGLAEYATARVWVDNFTLGNYLKRRRGEQFYLNTWHGDRAFKKIAYDANPDCRRRMEEHCDVMMAGSEFGESLLRSAFNYRGELINEGCPRNDCLVNYDPERAREIRRATGAPEGARILLYAPTFRDTTRQEAFGTDIDFERTLDDLEKKTGDKWVCFFRAHHMASGGLAMRAGGRMYDLSKYEDMADLLLITDALITDYSSSAMDYAILGRRVFIYQNDIEDYTAHDRAVYYPMEKSPFLIAHNQEELSRIIAETGDQEARENCRAIAEFFGFRETGHATQSAVDRIRIWLGDCGWDKGGWVSK